MKKQTLLSLITFLIVSNAAYAVGAHNNETFLNSSDFTGDSFFSAPIEDEYIDEGDSQEKNAFNNGISKTMPPLKRVRLYTKNKLKEHSDKNKQLAPTNPDDEIYNSAKNTSDFASKEFEEDFDKNMMPDGFEADEEAVNENNKFGFFKSHKNSANAASSEASENIILDCDNMDYDTNNYCLYAKDNVTVEFVKQNTIVKADTITFDRMNNTIKAEGNVRIIKNGQIITGDYIFVDMNEESALIENPVSKTATIEIHASKGYVYGDRIVQEDGSVSINESYPINLKPSSRGPQMNRMIIPKNQTLTEDAKNGLVRIQVKDIKISQKGEHEVLAIKHASVHKGKYTLIKIPALKIYTNKNHDYAETNSWELGSLRELGMYIGPGFVFELPKGSVLKAMPILNYSSRIGIGGLGRFHSGTNLTYGGYGTAKSKILLKGKQELDDNLYIQYTMNEYLDEWFLGRRRAKYGADLVYEKGYSSYDFLLKNKRSEYSHRASIGYFHDPLDDNHYGKLKGSDIGTMRFRYMGQATQNLYSYKNIEKQTALSLNISSQIAASVYGTGDTQVVGRVGPSMHTQFKRWMQDIGYYQSVYDDHTPLTAYDSYRYGKSNVYLREYLRICKYLTLSWFGSINLSGDSPNGRSFQENAFFVSVGPDDIKFSLGYDFVRENTMFLVELMMDAKGTKVDYDRMEIKQDKKAQENNDPKDEEQKNEFQNSNKAPVLRHAVVEDIKSVEDVL